MQIYEFLVKVLFCLKILTQEWSNSDDIVVSDSFGHMLKRSGDIQIDNWAIVVLIILFVLLATIRMDRSNYVVKLVQSFFNVSYSIRLFKEKVNYLTHVVFRLDLLYTFLFAMYMYHVIEIYHMKYFFDGIHLYLVIVFGVFLFSQIKWFILNISGHIFDELELTKSYVFFVKQSMRISVIPLLIIDVLMFVNATVLQYTFLFLGVGVLLLLFAVAVLKGVYVFLKKDFSIIYLILYLCSLEILPLLVLWKILWRGSL